MEENTNEKQDQVPSTPVTFDNSCCVCRQPQAPPWYGCGSCVALLCRACYDTLVERAQPKPIPMNRNTSQGTMVSIPSNLLLQPQIAQQQQQTSLARALAAPPSKAATCPACRKIMTAGLQRHFLAEAMQESRPIPGLMGACPYQGCGQEIPLERDQWKKHWKTCPFSPIHCPRLLEEDTCRAYMPLCNLPQHMMEAHGAVLLGQAAQLPVAKEHGPDHVWFSLDFPMPALDPATGVRISRMVARFPPLKNFGGTSPFLLLHARSNVGAYRTTTAWLQCCNMPPECMVSLRWGTWTGGSRHENIQTCVMTESCTSTNILVVPVVCSVGKSAWNLHVVVEFGRPEVPSLLITHFDYCHTREGRNMSSSSQWWKRACEEHTAKILVGQKTDGEKEKKRPRHTEGGKEEEEEEKRAKKRPRLDEPSGVVVVIDADEDEEEDEEDEEKDDNNNKEGGEILLPDNDDNEKEEEEEEGTSLTLTDLFV